MLAETSDVPADERQLVDRRDEQAVGYKQEKRARNIDGGFSRQSGLGNDLPRQISAPQAERHVDIEYPAPADGIDQKTAQGWAGEKADMKRRGSQTESAPALFRRQVHRDNRSAIGRDHGTAERLQRAEKNQLAGALRQAADSRGGHENQKPDAVKTAPAE